jgi:hypothetical protein
LSEFERKTAGGGSHAEEGKKQKVRTLRFSVPTFDGVTTSRVYGGDAEMLQRHHHKF